MTILYFLYEPRTIFNLQKCLLSDRKYLDEYYNQPVLLQFENRDYQFVCIISSFETQNLVNCCYIDDSVVYFPVRYNLKEEIPSIRRLNRKTDSISLQNINLLPRPIPAKLIELSIVFQNIDLVYIWKDKINLLQQSVKEILKLCTLTPNSVIYLDNFQDNQKIGIHALILYDINKSTQCHSYKINSSTKVQIFYQYSYEKFFVLQKSPKTRKKLSGLNNVYAQLEAVISISKLSSLEIKLCKQILLSGPPGCGKTTIVRQIAEENCCILLEILGPSLISPLPGDTEKKLQDVFQKGKDHAKNNEHCIIFLDQIDSIVSESSKNGTPYVKKNTLALIKLLEETSKIPGIAVIATTNNPEHIDPKLLRYDRLGDEIVISIPSEKHRAQILHELFTECELEKFKGIIKTISKWTNGYVGADLHLLVQNVASAKYKLKIDPQLDMEEILLQMFKKVCAKMKPALFHFTTKTVTNTPINLSDIAGLHVIKRMLYVSVILPLLHPESFHRLGIPFPKGILLYGPPGCAKTTLVKALASETNMTFLTVSSAELYSQYVGDTEKKISQLFHQARMCAPTIIFIDEIDALVGSRGTSKEQNVQERVLSTLLIEMDGVGLKLVSSLCMDSKLREGEECVGNVNVATKAFDNSGIIVVAATNKPDNVDEALKRPGRFDKLLCIPPPNRIDRLEILKHFASKMPLDVSVDLDKIADKTDLYSGADLRNVCTESALLALTEEGMDIKVIHEEHISKVLNSYKPSLTKTQVQFYSGLHSLSSNF